MVKPPKGRIAKHKFFQFPIGNFAMSVAHYVQTAATENYYTRIRRWNISISNICKKNLKATKTHGYCLIAIRSRPNRRIQQPWANLRAKKKREKQIKNFNFPLFFFYFPFPLLCPLTIFLSSFLACLLPSQVKKTRPSTEVSTRTTNEHNTHSHADK